MALSSKVDQVVFWQIVYKIISALKKEVLKKTS